MAELGAPMIGRANMMSAPSNSSAATWVGLGFGLGLGVGLGSVRVRVWVRSAATGKRAGVRVASAKT